MINARTSPVIGIIASVLVLASTVSFAEPAQSSSSEEEQPVWNLEHAYWQYVQENDLAKYLALWHKDVFAWPESYAAPAHKDHIADWITSATSKGLTLKAFEIKPAGIQINGNVAVTCYWITYEVLDKERNATSKGTSRITHTWLKNGNDWQIISGMSMPEPMAQQK